MLRLTIAAIVIGLCLAGAKAQEPGDPQAGLRYAQANCATCHEVERHGQVLPQLVAPPFYEIADTPGITGRALAAALDSSHKDMPNFVLRAEDRNDVIAYILSLRSGPR